MIEEPCIIQMNIDRYRAMLTLYMADEQRARVEQLLAEANRQLAEAIHDLAAAIDTGHPDRVTDAIRH